MPKVEFEGQSYSEMEMDKPTKNMQLINPAFGNYAIFLRRKRIRLNIIILTLIMANQSVYLKSLLEMLFQHGF